MKISLPKFKSSKDVRFVIMTEGESDVNQWSLSRNSLVAVSVLVIVLCAALLFFTSDFLTKLLYNSRLEEIKKSNHSLITHILELKNRVDELKSEMDKIEEKDRALRTYANLPPIDKDVRRLGVGGITLSRHSKLDEILPDIESKIAKLEIDLDNIAREIKLEKESYETIYDAIRYNSEKISAIPSLKPVEGGYLNTGFGYRKDPFTNERRFHYGLDISSTKGTPVYATADGKVVYASYKGNYGKSIKINHGYGYQTFYAHLNRIFVKSGQKVRRGDFIGEVGSTGRSTAPHLHYEVHYYSTPQDPRNYFFAGYLK